MHPNAAAQADPHGECEGRLYLPPPASARLTHWTLVPPTPAARAVVAASGGGAERGAIGWVGGVGRVAVRRGDWAWEALLPLGGVTAVLAVLTDAVVASSSTSSSSSAEAVHALLALLAALLARHPFHREAFLQAYGFHVVAGLLKKQQQQQEGQEEEGGPSSSSSLLLAADRHHKATADACLRLLHACGGAEHGAQLFWAGVQGLMLDWGLWGRAPFDVQVGRSAGGGMEGWMDGWIYGWIDPP